MGMFSNLMSKIFGHASATTASAGTAASTPAGAAAPGAPAPANAPAPVPTVDVEAMLNEMAQKNPEKLDWQKSIVDLMKLVGMDSSFGARKELAKELHYTGDMNDSASMNIWLHKEVIRQIAANGGKVPQSLMA